MGFKKALLVSILVAFVATAIIVFVFTKTGIIDWSSYATSEETIALESIETYNQEFLSGSCNNGIPDGCTYWYNTTATQKSFCNIYELGKPEEIGEKLSAGEQFVGNPKTGDIFTDGTDYMYVYNMKVTKGFVWVVDETLNGWGVRSLANKETEFSKPMISHINGKPVVCASYAFAMARITPETLTVPATITDVSGMFYNTKSLNINIEFAGTPEKYTDCFKDSNGFYITEDGMFCDFNPNAIVYLSGNCDEKIKEELAKTSEFENIVIK